jgi:hypothetical protein
MSNVKKLSPGLTVCVLILWVASACGRASSTATKQVDSGVIELPPTWTPAGVDVVQGTATIEAALPSAQPTPSTDIAEVFLPQDICELLPVEADQTFLGEAVVNTSKAESMCLHVLASGSSVTATVLRGEKARAALIDPIAQLSTQDDCTLSYSYSSDESIEPTPIPAEVESFITGISLAELAGIYLDLNAEQCAVPSQLVPGFGDLAFFSPLDLVFVETLTLGVISGEIYVTFTLATADPDADPETDVLQAAQGEEWLKSLAAPLHVPAQ